MREILFRGKRLDNGEWVYWDAIGRITTPNGKISRVTIERNASVSYYYRIEQLAHKIGRDKICQYTGLKDKNGKRIFEGDIIRHCNDNPYAFPDIVEKGEVYWDERLCGWRRTSNGAFHRGIVDTYQMSPCCVYEVIGNIHDNPELLGGGEDG